MCTLVINPAVTRHRRLCRSGQKVCVTGHNRLCWAISSKLTILRPKIYRKRQLLACHDTFEALPALPDRQTCHRSQGVPDWLCTLAINSAARDFLRKSRKSENSKENYWQDQIFFSVTCDRQIDYESTVFELVDWWEYHFVFGEFYVLRGLFLFLCPCKVGVLGIMLLRHRWCKPIMGNLFPY